MQAKWGGKGLSVLAVTDEGASETEGFVKETGMKYAYAYDKGGKLARHFGVRGIPHAVLIDASGTVAWAGHPGSLEERHIQQATAGALPKPLWEWSGGGKGVKNALVKRDYKGALALAGKLGPDESGAEILAAVQGMVKSKVEGLKAAQAKGDYLGAQEAAAALTKELAGLPEAAEASTVAAAIKADPKALEVIKGQQKLAKIRAREFGKKKERVAAIADLRKLRGEYPGTYVEVEADALIAQINEMAADE
jgi:thioredoxin-like negative regulator of GroEL